MPKPKGTMGATKMKIMAVICHNGECGRESYGYGIWQSLKENFHMYLNDNDVRNVYHHLEDLCDLEMINRMRGREDDSRCFYELTEKGLILKDKYQKYLEILDSKIRPSSYH